MTPSSQSQNSSTHDFGLAKSGKAHTGVPEQSANKIGDARLRSLSIEPSFSLDTYGGWQSFELMPPRYRTSREAQLTFFSWLTIVAILLTVTSGSAVLIWIKGQQKRISDNRLASIARPIRELKLKADLLEAENALNAKWVQWVSSARPDDSILQIMASVAIATHGDATSDQAIQGEDAHLDVQTIHIKLPLEYSGNAPKPPTWAEPSFSVSAIAKKRSLVMSWSDRLEDIGRLTNVKLNSPAGAWRQAQVQVDAMPLSTRTLP